MLLGDLNISGIELSVAVGLQRSEHITDDLFLPVNQFKWLSRPCAFGMAQSLNEANRIVSGIFIVVRSLGFEFGRLVLFQFSDMRSPPKRA